ncbi:aminoglycoside phosphotransferase family protein [Paenibacillus contaminans]|uniref:Aminoglycoside phosphotransferase family protein n=2 Tax=Paenibacillus contaminans TaxID=450362 RepID=A0A329MAE4_9BACL|nr:aminoglycoside phosphotransferase family protein [Paenibacillus contaminans]
MTGMVNEYEQFRKGIPLLCGSSKLERIHKGYSSDAKYIVYASDGRPQYILRTYGIDRDPAKRLEYNSLKHMEKHDVTCSRPIEIGVLPELELGYMIVSYLEGNEASEELPLLTEEEQFNIGVEAGLELLKIHQVSCPDDMKSWEERTAAKHRRYRKEYAECGVSIPNDEKFLSFIDDNLHLMKGRPNLYQHDDFHIGNLIVKDGKLSGVIDFNRYDWGDPIHEFLKVGMFSAEVSVPFAVGQIQGYHNRTSPGDEFWRLYSLYLGMTLVSSVVWILKVKRDELDEMLRKINKVMDDHSNFELTVPKWYSEYKPGF